MSCPQYDNCSATVAEWISLAKEARAAGANDAAGALEEHIREGKETLVQYQALAEAAQAARTERDAAYRASVVASASYNAGTTRHSEMMDAAQKASVLDRRVVEADGAVTTLLNRGIE